MKGTCPHPSSCRSIALGVAQIILFGGSFFLMAVIADPVSASTRWPRTWIGGALSIAILFSGLPAPFVGRIIRTNGGRAVLVAGAGLIAAGLCVVSFAPGLVVFLGGWALIGLGMAGCLYDPLFSAIGQVHGANARRMITQITLVSGFATTVCWPASHVLVGWVGWRGTCLAYAAAVLLVAVPIFLRTIPVHQPVSPDREQAAPLRSGGHPSRGLRELAASFTISSVIMTIVAAELLSLLTLRGVTAAHAVMLGALLGPAQFLARAFEGTIGRALHPYWGMLVSALCVLAGLSVLALAPDFAWLAIILYGIGNGIRTIVRGTLPLALYGQADYAAVMGKLARPPLVGQAVAPVAAALVGQHLGLTALLPVLFVAAVANLLLVLAVYPLARLPAPEPA